MSGRQIVLGVAVLFLATCGDDGQKPPGGTGETVTETIGPSGGTVTVTGAEIAIPPGALAGDQTITLTSTTDEVPQGYTAASPVFRLEPAGLVFLQPVKIRIQLSQVLPNTTVFWSKLGAPGYDDVGGQLLDTTILASNTHFSDVFAAQGPAVFAITPATQDYGSVGLGSTSVMTAFTVANAGGSSSGIVSAVIGGADAAQFAIVSNACTGPLAPGASCTITARFAPTTAGAKTATLTVGDGTASATAALAGSGLLPGGIQLSPTTQNFGTITLGASSAPVTFTATNTGGVVASPLTIAFGGTHPGDFSLGTDTCSSFALAGGASCTFTVRFSPAAGGARTAQITAMSSSGGTASAGLSGTGAASAALSVAPVSPAFGSVVLGSTSTAQTITVTNSGGLATGPLSLALAGTNANDFMVASTTCAGTALAAGASCTIAATFTPTAAGARSATLTIGGTPGGTATVSLSGSGLTPGMISVLPATAAFGAWLVGAPATTVALTVANPGASPTGTLAVAVSGANAADFSVTADTCQGTALAAAATCTVTLGFTPGATGARTASLAITGMPGGSVSVPLSGSGFAPANLVPSTVVQDFGSLATGQTSTTIAFTVTNAGGAPSGALTTMLAGPDAAAFAIVANTCGATTLAPGATCTISARFAPTITGNHTASLDIGATPGGNTSIALAGIGQNPANLSIMPTPQSFGSLVVGAIGAPVMFTVSNPGGVTSGTLAVSLGGAGAGQFTIDSDACHGVALVAGGSCAIAIVFAPSSPGAKAASLTVTGTPGGSAVAALSGTALSPAELVASSASHAFGIVPLGATSTATSFTFTNIGGVASGALATALTGPDAGEMAILADACTGVVLAPAASCTIAVNFSPTTVGAKSASLAATATPGGSSSIALSGTAVTPAAVSIAPPSQAYGGSIVGQTSADVTYTVTNTGGVPTGALGVALSGTGAGQFGIGTNTCSGTVLAPAATCTVNVHFSPLSPGAKSASLDITATPGGMASSALTGTGLAPAQLSIAPPSQDFGSVVTGTLGTALPFTITNVGDVSSGTITTGLVGASASQFAIVSDGCSGVTLVGGGTCTITARLAPSTAGMKTAGLQASSTPGGTTTSSLTGIGLNPAQLVITPTPATLATTPTGLTGTATQFTVTNVGDVPSGTLATSLGGTNASELSITANACGGVVLAAGGTCTISVALAPATTGAKSGTVSAAATPGGTATAMLSGTAVNPANLTISPTTQSFGSVVFGSASATSLFTVTNSGDVPSGSITTGLSGPDSTQFTIVTNTCASTVLAAAATCSIGVQFTPSTTGAKSANLTAGASPGGTATANLGGTGINPAMLSISPAVSQDFGTIVTNTSSATTFYTISNAVGSATSGTPSASIVGTDPTQFAIVSNTCTAGLVAGSFCLIGVQFQPTTAGAKSGSLSVTASPGGTVTGPFTGTAITPANLSISPAAQDYGTLVTGTQSSNVAFTVTNTGGQTSGVLTTSLAGTDPTQFAIVADSCSGVALAGAGTCSIIARFQPSTGGSKSATLTASATPGGMATAALAGTAITPANLSISPAAQDYGTLVTGTQSSNVAFTVTNTGGQTSSAVTTALAGADPAQFAIVADSCSGVTLASAATCTIIARFQPSTAGAKAATITASATVGGSTVTILSGVAIAPANLAISPASQDYGTIVVGAQSASVTYTVTNTGGQTSGVIATSLGGSDPAEFTIVANACSGVALVGGGTCSIVARFEPTTSGAKSASLGASATPGGSATASIAGTAVSPASLSIAPTSHDYGSVITGTQSANVTFTVTNTGGASTSTLSTTFSGDVTEFAIVATTCAGIALAPAATCVIFARFNPTTTGVKGATIGASATAGGTANASLTGTGIAPAALSISPTPIDFGNVVVGSQSAATTFTVTNTGGAATGTLATTLGGSNPLDFQIVGGQNACASIVLAAGASCTLQVRFAPMTAGPKSATLDVTATPGGTVSSALAGTGTSPVASLGIAPTSHDYGNVNVGSTSTTFTFTVTNNGGAASGIPVLGITGTNAAEFSYLNNTCVSALAPSASCTVGVVMAPTSTGAKSASFDVSATPGGSVSASLSGNGFIPLTLSISPPSTDFGTVYTGFAFSSIVSFTVQNTSPIIATGILTPSITGPDANQFQLAGGTCSGASIPAGASCTVDVYFDPTSVGAKTATLEVSGNPGGTITAALSGNGIDPTIQISGGGGFGSVATGSTSAPQTLTVLNTSAVAPTGMITTSSTNGYFEIVPGQDSCNGVVLAPGASCTLQVQFHPLTSGPVGGQIRATANPGGIAVAGVSGTGI